MKKMRIGVVRYASIAPAIAEALDISAIPELRIGQGRITITFRRHGASRWTEEEKMEYAIYVAETVRRVLSTDERWVVRRRARRAVVVVYDDTMLLRGLDVRARWECVIPASATR